MKPFWVSILILASSHGMALEASSCDSENLKSWSSVSDESKKLPGAISNSLTPDIEAVELVMVDLTQEDLVHISKLKHLKSLIIGNLPEGERIPDGKMLNSLRALESLECLSIAIHGLSEADLGFVIELKNLRILRIRSPLGTRLGLTKSFAAGLAKMEKLVFVEIWDTDVREETLSPLLHSNKNIKIKLRN